MHKFSFNWLVATRVFFEYCDGIVTLRKLNISAEKMRKEESL
jgi:hypothetical protein